MSRQCDRRRRRPGRRRRRSRPLHGAAAAVEAGRDPRHRGPAARRARGGVRPHDRRRGGQADPHGQDRGAARRRRRSSSPPPRHARSPASSSRSMPSPPGEGKVGFAMRVPIGVVGAISPFNFPLNLVAHKVAPAIAAGCPVVLKPASQTPLSAVALAALLVDECGLPAAYLHVVTGGGGTVGNAIVEHPDIAMITFTGSPEVGWGIRARAPRKRVGLELGNNAPVIIEADSDWKTAAEQDPRRRVLPRRAELHLDPACARAPRHRRGVHVGARRRGVDARRRRPTRRRRPRSRR